MAARSQAALRVAFRFRVYVQLVRALKELQHLATSRRDAMVVVGGALAGVAARRELREKRRASSTVGTRAEGVWG